MPLNLATLKDPNDRAPWNSLAGGLRRVLGIRHHMRHLPALYRCLR